MGDNRIVDAPSTLVYFGKNIPKKTGIPSGGSKIQSRYRRASIGSCHDLCKNGRRRDSESIQRSPISKCHHIVPIVTKHSPIQASDFEAKMHGYPPFKEKDGKSSGRRISVSLPPSPLPSYKARTMIDIRKEMGVSEVDKTKAVVPLPISQSLQTRVKRGASIGSGNNANKEHRRVPDPSLSPNQHHRSKPQPKKPIEEEAPEKILHLIESTASYKTPQNGVHPSLPLKGSLPKELKTSSHSKTLSQLEDTSLSRAQTKISPAHLSPAMSLSEQVGTVGCMENVANPEEETESSPWNGRLFSSGDKDYSLKKLHFRRGMTIETCQIKKTSPTSPSLQQESVRDKNQNVEDLRMSFEGVEDNTSDSRITKIEHKKVVLHQQDGGKKKVEDKVANPEMENRNSLWNSRRLIGSEDNDYSKGKLLFRRGKVVETQCENTLPSYLTFRRGTVLEENQKGERDHRKSFKGREEDHISDPKITKIKHEKVVLQHRDHGRKKNVHKFEYNVIDETAKEGMVRALVSAFETLNTLQDHKPSQVASAF